MDDADRPTRTSAAPVAVLGGGLAVAGLLLVLVSGGWRPLLSLDEEVSAAANAAVARSGTAVDVAAGLTVLGGGPVATLLFVGVAVALAVARRWRASVTVATTGLVLLVLVPLAKTVIGRPRPSVPVPVVALPESLSFPSGHATTAAALYGVLALTLPRLLGPRSRVPLALAATVVAGTVGVTRVVLGVHYVSDVVAGWALGCAVVAAVVLLVRSDGATPATAGRRPRSR